MVSFCCNFFSSESVLVNELVLEGFSVQIHKIHVLGNHQPELVQRLVGEGFSKRVEVFVVNRGSIQAGFGRNGFVGGNRIFQFFDSGAFSGTCQHDFCVQLRFEIWNVQ